MKYPGIILLINLLLMIVSFTLVIVDLDSCRAIQTVYTLTFIINGLLALHNIHTIRNKQ